MFGIDDEVEGSHEGASGLVFCSEVYERDELGRYVFTGERPSELWHGHGYTESHPVTLRQGRLVLITVRKHRFRHVGTGRTITCQPPDLLPRRRVCVLVVSCLLLAALTAPLGVHARGPDAPGVRSVRQVQRDLAAAVDLAEHTQHAVRAAVIDLSVPRPGELIWRGGLDPPQELARRCRHPSAPVAWTALEILRISAEQLGLPTTCLLAEARGRWTGPDLRFLI